MGSRIKQEMKAIMVDAVFDALEICRKQTSCKIGSELEGADVMYMIMGYLFPVSTIAQGRRAWLACDETRSSGKRRHGTGRFERDAQAGSCDAFDEAWGRTAGCVFPFAGARGDVWTVDGRDVGRDGRRGKLGEPTRSWTRPEEARMGRRVLRQGG